MSDDPSVAVTSHKTGFIRSSLAQLRNWMENANGWQRLWFVGTVIWIAFISYKIAHDFPEMTSYDQTVQEGVGIFGGSYCASTASIDWTTTRTNIWSFLGLYVSLLILAPLFSYATGVASSWVAGGFRERNKIS